MAPSDFGTLVNPIPTDYVCHIFRTPEDFQTSLRPCLMFFCTSSVVSLGVHCKVQWWNLPTLGISLILEGEYKYDL